MASLSEHPAYEWSVPSGFHSVPLDATSAPLVATASSLYLFPGIFV
jgi:hypothetical protein